MKALIFYFVTRRGNFYHNATMRLYVLFEMQFNSLEYGMFRHCETFLSKQHISPWTIKLLPKTVLPQIGDTLCGNNRLNFPLRVKRTRVPVENVQKRRNSPGIPYEPDFVVFACQYSNAEIAPACLMSQSLFQFTCQYSNAEVAPAYPMSRSLFQFVCQHSNNSLFSTIRLYWSSLKEGLCQLLIRF